MVSILLLIGVPTAVMLAAAYASRSQISRPLAALTVVSAALIGGVVLFQGVANTYAQLGESEGHGAKAFAFLLGVIWFFVASISLFLISRARTATRLGSESRK